MNIIEAFQLAIVSVFTSLGKGLLRLLLPERPVFAMAGAGGDPNALGTFLYMVPMDGAFASTPTSAEVGICACPDDLGIQLALEYVGFRANTLPADSSAVTGDLEWIDDSNSDTPSDLVTGFSFKGATALVNNTVFVGWQVLDPGDVINFEITTDGGITTPSVGAAAVVMGKILTKSS